MSIINKVQLKDSIVTQLITVVFSIYFAVTLTVTLTHMIAEFLETKDGIVEELKIYHSTFEDQIGLALWAMDDSQIDAILTGIMKIPSITAARIVDAEGNKVAEKGELEAKDNFGASFTLKNKVKDRIVEVGQITLYSSNEVVLKKVQYGFIFILVNAVVKTTALWVIFIVVARKMLSQPLGILTKAAEELELDNLKEQNISIQSKGRTELKILEEAFNKMIKKLIAARNSIGDKVRMEAELKTAAIVQQALFPKTIPHISNLEISSFFQSASETGGDWYGFVAQVDNSLSILIGDVTGHGTPAAIVTATAATTCKALEEMCRKDNRSMSPATVLQYLNKVILEMSPEGFLMTFFVAKIDLHTGTLTFANAGHNFPIMISNDGKINHLLASSLRLGFKESTTYADQTLHLTKGDTLVFYTDGLIENLSPEGEMWTERNLVKALKKRKNLSAREIINGILYEANEFWKEAPIDDDVTMVVCRVVENFPGQQ